MIARYPDTPVQSSELVLPTLPEGQWIAQMKYDGWRCLVEVRPDRHLLFTTRHDKPCPVSDALRRELIGALGRLPAGTVLDGEWMCRRAGVTHERLWLFDVLRLDRDDWQLPRPAADRFALLRELVPADLVVPWATGGYAAFFEQTKGDPATEGVVLKHVASSYLGSTRECRTNPMWLKVKWRAGGDGQRLVA